MDREQETVYRTNDDSHFVMSEKVQSLAGSVYQEFEKMIAKYDHDVVKDLMPLVVNVLECLDTSYTENQEHEVELELLREDNEQLVTQYEREKQLRKNTEQKLLEVEDAVEDERKELGCKIESLESIVRMLELKAKNSSDHVFRLEEKECEMKKEYSKLHERYTELFKTHVDYMERAKMLMSTSDRMDPPTSRCSRMPSIGMGQLNRSSGPVSFGFQSLDEVQDANSPEDLVQGSPQDSTNSNTSLKNELSESQEAPPEQTAAPGAERNVWGTSKVVSPDDTREEEPPSAHTPMGRSTTKREQRSGNTLYQELSFQDMDVLGEVDEGADITGSWVHPGEYASSANDNFFGMGKEVENLIMENNELLATKNALNIVKDDLIVKLDELTSEHEILREELKSLHALKSRLRDRVSDLEEELKRMKEEATKAAKAGKSDDEEDDVPMSQRKRFTRVEMARVLMERNQYKERFMELQEAVRWTEMIRASRSDLSMDKSKEKHTIWKYQLFRMTGEKELVGRKQHVNLSYTHAMNHVTPTLAVPGSAAATGDKKRLGADYMDRGNVEKLAQRKAQERKEQYRQVRAHVRKEDGRLQAYGWSLPAKLPTAQNTTLTNATATETTSRGHVPVPVPVYCQPLQANQTGVKDAELQIWCAAGVNLSGGRTRDGGSIVGGSVFYTRQTPSPVHSSQGSPDDAEPHITQLEHELKEGVKVREEGETLEQRLSSLVWICASTRSESRVTLMDASKPAETVEMFTVTAGHLLCVASVPGATETDYCDDNNTEVDNLANNNTSSNTAAATDDTEGADNEDNFSDLGRIEFVKCEDLCAAPQPEATDSVADESKSEVKTERMSSVLPTMWLGAHNSMLYVHSSVSNLSTPIHTVKMADAVLSIVHTAGRVLVALANGCVAVFRRGPDAQWDMSGYHIVTLGCPKKSVRCVTVVHGTVWCGYNNMVHVLDPTSLTVKMSVVAHPRKESQVRLMAWLGDGVWVSIRLDSTLRLYHAHTYQHLQDVDIEPYVSKMLGTGKLGFSFVRITALLVSTGRLWIGTGNGVIISVPLTESTHSALVPPSVATRGPGGVVRVYTDTTTNKILPGSFVPFCSMAHAQLSFHGHRDSVKFFIAVPGSKAAVSNPSMLVMSGGEGYIDFRIGDGGDEEGGTGMKDREESETDSADCNTELLNPGDLSHLIIWQVSLPT